MATLNPFSNTNVLDHIISPKIVGPTGGGYQVAVDLVDIDTITARQLGSTGRVIEDIFVNRLHWGSLVPTGGTGTTGGTGASSLLVAGRGITLNTSGNLVTISSNLGLVPGPGISIAQVGNTYTIGSYSLGVSGSTAAVGLAGPTGQILYFGGGGGISSSSSLSFDGTSLTLPTTVTDSKISGGVLRTFTSSGSAFIQPGVFNAPSSASSLFITPVGGGNSTLTVNTSTERVGVNNNNPQSALDVSGQTQITYNSTNGGNTTTVLVGSGVSGNYTATPGTYRIQGWGGGGAGNGGTGGAGGYYSAVVNISAGGAFTWGPQYGGPGGGGNALVVNFGGSTTLIVPGGGAGTTGGIGASVGVISGSPAPQGGISAPAGSSASATYTDTRNWIYNFSSSIGLTGATFANGTISGLTSLGQTGTTVSFTPGASQVSGPLGSTYTAPPGTFIRITPNNMLFTASGFSTTDERLTTSSIPVNVVDGGTGTTGVTGTAVANYTQWPSNAGNITGSPTIVSQGTFSFTTPNVTWSSGSLGFTAGSTYTFFFDGPISDVGPVGNNNINLTGNGRITTNNPLPTISNAVIGVSSVTVLPNSTVSVVARSFTSYGQAASGNIGAPGGGGGAIGGGSAALVTGVTGMTLNTPGNLPAGGGAGSGSYVNVAGLSYVGIPVAQTGLGIYPFLNSLNQSGAYGIGGTGNSTTSSFTFLAIQQVTPQPQSALIVNGISALNGSLSVNGTSTLNGSLSVNGTSTLNGSLSVTDGADLSRTGAGTGARIGNSPNTPQDGNSLLVTNILDVGGNSRMTGDVTIGVAAGYNAFLRVGSAPVVVANAGDIVASRNVYGQDVVATSDIRFKHSIVTVDSALDKVLKLRGVFFERTSTPGERRVGVVAQEVEPILPEVVYTDDNGIKSVSYGSMIGLLIEAIKELNTK